MKKFSRRIAKIGLVLCVPLLILGIIFNDVQAIQFYILLIALNLITLFLDRIMNDIQKVLNKVYNYINK